MLSSQTRYILKVEPRIFSIRLDMSVEEKKMKRQDIFNFGPEQLE